MKKLVDNIRKWWKTVRMTETERWLSSSHDLADLERKLKFLSNQSTDPFSKLY